MTADEQEIRAAFRAGADWAMWAEGYSGEQPPDEDEYISVVLASDTGSQPDG